MKRTYIITAALVAVVLAGAALYTMYISGGQKSVPQDDHGAYIVGDNLLLGTDANSDKGTYIIGFNGRALYTFKQDTPGVSTCTDACAEKWPPYVVADGTSLNVKSPMETTDAGFIKRQDGKTQVTYKGMPLYFYYTDKDGDTNGDGVGGVWFLAKP